jgi:hypothetical protein
VGRERERERERGGGPESLVLPTSFLHLIIHHPHLLSTYVCEQRRSGLVVVSGCLGGERGEVSWTWA